MVLNFPDECREAVTDKETPLVGEPYLLNNGISIIKEAASALVTSTIHEDAGLSNVACKSDLSVLAQKKRAVTILLEYSDLKDVKKAHTMAAFLALADSIEITESDPRKAGMAIKKHLHNAGWEYKNEVFQLDEMLKIKGGNCLGLSLLIGAVLDNKGIYSNYAILSEPTDAISKNDPEVLADLECGEYFSGGDPQLFSLQRWEDELADIDRPNRFGLAEHPVIMQGNHILETTNFNNDDDEAWSPTQWKTLRTLTYEQLASTLIIEQLRRDPLLYQKLIEEQSRNAILAHLQRSLKIWPENYDAHHQLCIIARYIRNRELEQESLTQFKALHAENARYYFMLYSVTGDLAHLRKSYELCPTAIPVYLEYTKMMCTSKEDQKFNLAVASYMVAFSSERSLVRFYEDEQAFIEATYGEDYFLSLMDD